MSGQMPDMVRNLKRTAINAAWTMTVDRSMVLKLVAAAELAEAVVNADVLAYFEVGDDEAGARYHAAVQDEELALDAYRTARSAK